MLNGKNCVFGWLVVVGKLFINLFNCTCTMWFLQTGVYINNLSTQLTAFLYTPLNTYLTALTGILSPQTTPLTTTTIYLNFIIN